MFNKLSIKRKLAFGFIAIIIIFVTVSFLTFRNGQLGYCASYI